MNSNTRLVDDAAMIQVEVARLRKIPDSTNEQIDAVANAVVKLALYIAERDGLTLTQP